MVLVGQVGGPFGQVARSVISVTYGRAAPSAESCPRPVSAQIESRRSRSEAGISVRLGGRGRDGQLA